MWNYLGLKCVNGAVHDCSLAVCCMCKIELKCHRGTSSLVVPSKHPLEYSETSLKRKTTGCYGFADDCDLSLFSTSQYYGQNMYYF